MTRTTKIKRNEWDEYEVHLYEDGTHVEAATYFTDDKEDATLTAKAMCKPITDPAAIRCTSFLSQISARG